MSDRSTTRACDALTAHLRRELGAWPPTAPLTIATSAARTSPGWDGAIRRVSGVRSPDGIVLSVPQQHLHRAQAIAAQAGGLASATAPLQELLGGRLGEAMFRWCEVPADLPPLGEWLPVDHPVLPDWLRPFGGEALVARDAHGGYLAGVGLKRHDAFSREIAVGTEPQARGQGLARRLVATAAREILRQGMVPLYFHAMDNEPSARVADAAGFPDRGWRLVFLASPDEPVQAAGAAADAGAR